MLNEVHIISLAGLGSAYQIKGYFTLHLAGDTRFKVNFKGVVYGGFYGGHNVSIEISRIARNKLVAAAGLGPTDLDELLSEVQRRLLNGEMIVDYKKIKPEKTETFSI